MADQQLTLAMRLYADAARFVHTMGKSEGVVRRFGRGVRAELGAVRRALGTVQGQFAALGVTVGATATAIQSAQLDKTLTQIALTAGEGRDKAISLRKELFTLAQQTGRPLEDLQQGFNNLIQAGLQWDEALEVIRATNKAMAVTSAQADVLTGGLSVAAEAFQFDLSQPGKALELLDQMTVAGRLGNAELENLSDIFARVGGNAKIANLSFAETLAYIEGLSMIERQPERLATLADASLRLFTDLRVAMAARKATGVRFFEEGTGARRKPLDVLRDLRAEFQKLETDAQRAVFIEKAFGSTDVRARRGLLQLMTGGALDNVRRFSGEIGSAAGVLDKDLGAALDNAVDQGGRLKSVLREAADAFVQPINDAVKRVIKFGLDSKQQGGLGLSGGQIIGGGVALAIGAVLAKRGVGALINRFGRTAGGVAEGKALEAAAGVTPVFVVNWPGGIGGGVGDFAAGAAGAGAINKAVKSFGGFRAGAALLGGTSLRALPMLGIGAISSAVAAVLASGAVGAGIGTLIDRYLLTREGPLGTETGAKIGEGIGEGVARALAMLGHEESRRNVERAERAGTNLMSDQQFHLAATALNPVLGLLNMTNTLRDAIRGGSRARDEREDIGGTLKIEFDDSGRPRVRELRNNSRLLEFDVLSGPAMVMP